MIFGNNAFSTNEEIATFLFIIKDNVLPEKSILVDILLMFFLYEKKFKATLINHFFRRNQQKRCSCLIKKGMVLCCSCSKKVYVLIYNFLVKESKDISTVKWKFYKMKKKTMPFISSITTLISLG